MRKHAWFLLGYKIGLKFQKFCIWVLGFSGCLKFVFMLGASKGGNSQFKKLISSQALCGYCTGAHSAPDTSTSLSFIFLFERIFLKLTHVTLVAIPSSPMQGLKNCAHARVRVRTVHAKAL